MNKTIKLEIIKPTKITWYLLNRILYDSSRKSREFLNKAIRLAWEYDGHAHEYKKFHGEYPKENEFLENEKGKGISLSGYIYNQIKNESYLYSGNLSYMLNEEIGKYKKNKPKVLKGESSIPKFDDGQPVWLKNDTMDMTFDRDSWVLNVKLLNREGIKYYTEMYYNEKEELLKKKQKSSSEEKKYYMENIDLTDGIKLLLRIKGNYQKAILKSIMRGEYKIGGSLINKKGRDYEWFVNLTYSFEPEKKQLNENNIMGIDLGVNNPVYIAFNNSLNRFPIEGDEITKFRNSIMKRRISMLRQGKYCGDGRIGHGRKTRVKPIEKLNGKVENFKKTINEKYSRYVIELAKKFKCGIIQMEDLTGIADGDKKGTFLGGWTYYNLQQKIISKAEQEGIEIRFIKPQYTSARCSDCGHIHKKENKHIWRNPHDQFKCMSCDFGHKYFVHADYNAARNIATPDIENIIDQQLKKQEMELKHNLKYSI